MLTIPPVEDRPLDSSERAAVLDRVDEILELTHRSRPLGNFEDPLEEAVFIVLTRQTREATYKATFAALRARWPDWESLADAPPADVEAVIRPAGFGASRTREIQGLLRAVRDECARRGVDGVTLDWLRRMPSARVERYLVTLPGVNVKSARCVMHYALGRNVFAVDTHVARILGRLGIVAPAAKPRHEDYDAEVPARMRRRLHVNLVHHGRAFCRAQSPDCGGCPLVSFCATGRARVAAARVAPPATGTRARPVAVELFAGGGGMGEGFARAGFDVAVAVEIDRAAAQTYRMNHPGTVVLEADATRVTAGHLGYLSPPAATATALIAGPPCQGYSMAGNRKADDGKNVLYKAVVDLAASLRPRFVVIENVPGLRKVEGRSFVSTINDALAGAGYDSREHLLRACDFGVPQLRHRMLFLAQRADLGPAPAPPAPTHCAGARCPLKCGDAAGSRCGLDPTPTVVEALAGLPRLPAGTLAEHMTTEDGQTLLNGSTMAHSDRVVEKISGIIAGAGPISYRRLHSDLARTIVAGHRALPVHPDLDRTLSVREAARIQGFDDGHVFCGSRSQQPLQVANAVPPRLAEVVALALLAARATQAGEICPLLTRPLERGRHTRAVPARPRTASRGVLRGEEVAV